MSVEWVWRAIKNRWPVVAGVSVVMALLAVILTMATPPMYTATAEGLVSVGQTQNRPPYALTNGSQYILDRMTSYAQLGVTSPVVLPVVAKLQLREPLREVAAQSVANKALLRVSVTYSDPTSAARIADAIMQQLGETIARIENGNVILTEVTPAPVPSSPSNRNVLVSGGVAAVAGLIIGAFAALVLQFISERAARRRAGGTWVMDMNAYMQLCRAGHASLVRQLAADGLLLVPTRVDKEIGSGRTLRPDIPSVRALEWGQTTALTEEEDLTQIQVKAQMGGSVDQHLRECAVIACALHRKLTAVLDERAAVKQAQRLGVRTCGILWIIIQAYKTLYDRDREVAAAVVDDLLAAGMHLPIDSGDSLFAWADHEGLLS